MRLKFLLRATLQPAVYSLNFSQTKNEKKEVNKSLSDVWLLNLDLMYLLYQIHD